MVANKQNWRNSLKACILLNLTATIVAFSFNIASFGPKNFSVHEFVEAFVYSNCIGSLLSYAVFYISPRWNENPLIIRLIKVLVLIFVATFLGVIFARLILALIFPALGRNNLIPDWQNFVFSLSIAFTFGFGVYFYGVSQAQLRQKELDEEKAKKLATEAQLASLASRIHPHFLFNTLNSIAALVREDPLLAEKIVERLSALLRYSLDSEAKGLVTLKQELEITEKYLEIEKVRFAERLHYRIDCKPQFLETKIPPLSLQTLVENSIKHVASKTSERTEINVSVSKNGAGIIIEVRDTGDGFSIKDVQENHGLDNLQRRLQTVFDGQASVEIVEKGAVRLKIPNKKS